MDYRDITAAMRDLGFPSAYGEFTSPPSIPYTVVIEQPSNDMQADNHNYKKIRGYQLELYTLNKFPPDEQKIEDKLDEMKIPYRKFENQIQEEGLYQIVYEIQLIGG